MSAVAFSATMAPHGWDRDWEMPFSGMVRGFFWRLTASVLAPVAWLSGTLLYLGFWAHGLSFAQVAIVGVVSVLTLFAALTLVWVSYGLGLHRRWVDA